MLKSTTQRNVRNAMGFFFLNYLISCSISVCLAFNIDTTATRIFTTEQKDFFQNKVLQLLSDKNNGTLVTAPEQLGPEETCTSDLNLTHRCIIVPEISPADSPIPIRHFGLSISEDAMRSQITVCSPSAVHPHSGNSSLNKVCYKMKLDRGPSTQEQTNKSVEVVFLFDGSASMTEAEFNKNKDFIVEIMESHRDTPFAAVQFSYTVHKVFDFNDYDAGRALDKLMKEKHLKTLTMTHKALEFVLDEIFDNNATGASPDVTKVLILITDGDPSDTDRRGIIKRYDDKNITRLVIKDAKLDKFRAIASEPKHRNAFKIEDYDGLTGVLENLQEKIFTVEGDDSLIVGSVGSNSWRSFLTYEIQSEHLADYYLAVAGNSISIGKKNGVPLYFVGLPEFEQTGQVVFRHRCEQWTELQRIRGEQIGSYFGAELCSLDVDSDGSTDFLLVGAPQFHLPQVKKEGRVYIYSVSDETVLESNQDVTGPSMGRFGTTISSLPDLNGDGLRDVAVGAPLEDDKSGAVYIYHGNRQRGIVSTFSQRIMGKNIDHGLKFFGRAIFRDLGEDGLPGVVVESHGAAVVFRSKPVFNVLARLSFHPENFDTLSPDTNVALVKITACFEKVEATKSKVVSSALNITYILNVMGQASQSMFSQTLELRDENTCVSYSINRAVRMHHPASKYLNIKDILHLLIFRQLSPD
uniref:VWFA domain-containing protein n=1 Tax=Oreochromis aureus TaxID=47969 RepID=A0A668T3W8_OREAU